MHDSFGEFLGSGLAVPLLEGLVRDFSLNQKLCEFAPLGLALKAHRASRIGERNYTEFNPALASPVAYLLRMQALGTAMCKVFRISLLSAKTFPQYNEEERGPRFPILAIELPESGWLAVFNPIGDANVTSQLWLDTNLVRLQKAVLCANCEVISEGLNGHCACCGSQSLLALSRVLGGTIDSEELFGFSSAHAANDDRHVSSLAAAA